MQSTAEDRKGHINWATGHVAKDKKKVRLAKAACMA